MVHVKTAGTEIYCGLGEVNKCSPFSLFVEPGLTVAQTTEAESRAAPGMDSLVEAGAGDTGSFSIQAKDTFGNNRITGGDTFVTMMTLQSDPSIQFRGTLLDLANGSYVVTYKVPIAGLYDMLVTYGEEEVLTCIDPYKGTKGYLFDRDYDGVDVYVTPPFCTHDMPTLEVVHHALHPSSSTVVDGASNGLSEAVVGITNFFTIEARDAHDNIRAGDDTPNFDGGYGDGQSDFYLVELLGSDGYTVVTSSAVQMVQTNNSASGGYFRLSFAGTTTYDLPADASASAIATALESMFGNDPHAVEVSRSEDTNNMTYVWTVTFSSHLDELYPDISSPGIMVLPAVDGNVAASKNMEVRRPASGGMYPVEYTLWSKGTYEIAITSNHEHVRGSPFTLEVDDGEVYAESTTASGQGLVGGIAGQSVAAREGPGAILHP